MTELAYVTAILAIISGNDDITDFHKDFASGNLE